MYGVGSVPGPGFPGSFGGNVGCGFCGFGGFGVGTGIIAIATLILIALGVIF